MNINFIKYDNAKPQNLNLSRQRVTFLVSLCWAGLNPGAEYGIGVTAIKTERESLPATTNAETGERHFRSDAKTLVAYA